MDRIARRNRKLKIGKLIEANAKPNTPFCVWDVRAWWARTYGGGGLSVKEVSKILPGIASYGRIKLLPKDECIDGAYAYEWNGESPVIWYDGDDD